MSFVTAPRRRRLALLLAGCLAAAVGGFAVGGTAVAISPTTPTSMKITAITSQYAAPANTPDGAAPTALVKAGVTFTVRVGFFIGTQPASFSSNTNLKISSTAGTLSSTTGLAMAGQDHAFVTTSIKEVLNRVGVTVTVANGPAKGLTTGPPTAEWLFDVLSDIQVKPATIGSAFTDGIGGDTACANATSSDPVCAIVVLPRGAGDSVLLSVGACDKGGSYAPCYVGPKKTGGAVVQSLFAQPPSPADAYSTTSPATVIVKCDKTLCGTGSIQDLSVMYSLGGDDPLVRADPCPAKNTMASARTPCVDYVQSKRDGSGDTHLYLLTDGDIRTGIG